jgi:hypothetical protein
MRASDSQDCSRQLQEFHTLLKSSVGNNCQDLTLLGVAFWPPKAFFGSEKILIGCEPKQICHETATSVIALHLCSGFISGFLQADAQSLPIHKVFRELSEYFKGRPANEFSNFGIKISVSTEYQLQMASANQSI